MAKNPLGNWAFLLGAVIVLIAGIGKGVNAAWVAADSAGMKWLGFILVVLGLTIGFVNITKKEIVPFLLSALALIAIGSAETLLMINEVIPVVGSLLQGVVQYAVMLVGPAALVVAVKAAYDLAAE